MKKFTWLLLLMMMLICMDMGKTYYEHSEDDKYEKNDTIKNISIELQETYYNITFDYIEYNDTMTIHEMNYYKVSNIITKVFDSFIFVTLEFGSIGITYGYIHNNYPYGLMWKIVFGFIIFLSLTLPVAIVYIIYRKIKDLIMKIVENNDRE